MKKIVSVLLIGLFLSNSALFAQEVGALESETTETAEIVVTDENDSHATSENSDITFSLNSRFSKSMREFLHENDGKKHWLVAVSGALVFNVGMSSYNRWIIGSSWAQVGPDEWAHFWERELKYDRDWYWTNFVLHPYQGAIYYQVSRGSNLNKIESFGVTLLGSAFWEYLCETNAPSINDMVYTTLGSFSLGEMLYRLSLNADEISELFGIIINPTRTWTQGWTRQKPLGTTRNIHALSVQMLVGTARSYTNAINFSGDYPAIETYPSFANPSVTVVYNDPYGHDSNDPYSQFELTLGGALGIGSGEGAACAYEDLDKKLMYHVRILSNGMLFARAPQLSENTDTTIGLSMMYEFDWHQFYELSSLAPGVGIKQRVRFNNSRIEWFCHGSWIALGTTDYYYYHRPIVDKGDDTSLVRSYNFTTGAQTNIRFRYTTDAGSMFNFDFRGYAMYDFYSQLQDNTAFASAGWEWIGIANLSLELPLSPIVRLGLCDEVYAKRAFYKKVPDVFQTLNSFSVYAKLQLK